MLEIKEIKRRQGKKAEAARTSSTDAETTDMKMGDGGFRSACNTQLATGCDSQIIKHASKASGLTEVAQWRAYGDRES